MDIVLWIAHMAPCPWLPAFQSVLMNLISIKLMQIIRRSTLIRVDPSEFEFINHHQLADSASKPSKRWNRIEGI